MRLNGFRCDTCCKEHLLEPTVTYRHVTSVIPDDWFMLWLGKYEDGKEPLLFCSVECLAQWAEKQVIVAREAEPARGGLIVDFNPEYTKALQGIGEATYKRLMHGNWLPGDEE